MSFDILKMPDREGWVSLVKLEFEQKIEEWDE